MENGIVDLRDFLRLRYIKEYVEKMFEVIQVGVDVRGYFYWVLIDNYEWVMGFKIKFGFYEVDLISKQRIFCFRSVEIYKKIVWEGLF